MIIRATAKLLKIARVSPVKNESSISGALPGEWYASLLNTGRNGVYAIHFLHNPTMISIIVLNKSLTRALEVLPARVAAYLIRNRFSELVPGFGLDSQHKIYTTNSRNILANMTQMKFDIEYNLAISEVLDSTDIDRIEDLYLRYILGGKIANGDYIMPVNQLFELLEATDGNTLDNNVVIHSTLSKFRHLRCLRVCSQKPLR